jgi:hypothetical protein
MFGRKSKTDRWAEAMKEQLRNEQVRHSTPTAYVLSVVDNGPEHGWKWLVWDYDPDHVRLHAGAIEGVCVPHGMKDGFPDADTCRAAGLAAIRKTWSGDVVLREQLPVRAGLTENGDK